MGWCMPNGSRGSTNRGGTFPSRNARTKKNGPHVRPVFHCSDDYVRQLAGRYFGRMLVPELVGSQNHTVIGGAAVPAAVAQFTGLLGAGVPHPALYTSVAAEAVSW